MFDRKSLFALALFGQAITSMAWGQARISAGEVDLVYQGKTNEHVEEYKSVFFSNGKDKFELLPSSPGVTYAPAVSKEDNVSKDGGYFFINKFESGNAISDGGDSSSSARSGCVFVETKSGCVVYQGAGDTCDGHWQSGNIWASASGDIISIGGERPSIKDIMTSYAHIKSKVKLVDVLNDSPLPNILRCDPVNLDNRAYYEQAAKDLSGDREDRSILTQALGE